ncbi:MAG: sulfurtransferase [Chloroflexi bacterium]|nr:sulfurtransferase [Chloroflexota bacterium]
MSSTSTYANPSALVSTDWVHEHLHDPNVRLLEVDVDTTAYERGHIHGAVGINWTTQLGDPIRRDIPTCAAFEQLMRLAGVSNTTQLILYGDNNNWFAAFGYWVARMYGHTQMALMNGGRKKWELEGRALVTDPPRVLQAEYHATGPDLSLRAYLKDMLAVVEHGANASAMVDVRSPAEFNGEIIAPPGLPETAQRCGHIPGAQNIPWAQAANDDGTFKSADQLRELYGAKGITPDKPVVAYCRIGERSSHTWFVLKELLGFPNVRNYDGSWTEYGSVIGVPIDNPAAAPPHDR